MTTNAHTTTTTTTTETPMIVGTVVTIDTVLPGTIVHSRYFGSYQVADLRPLPGGRVEVRGYALTVDGAKLADHVMPADRLVRVLG
jgi:hypothetical protein